MLPREQLTSSMVKWLGWKYLTKLLFYSFISPLCYIKYMACLDYDTHLFYSYESVTSVLIGYYLDHHALC